MAEPFSGMTDAIFGYDTDIHFKDGDLQLTTGVDYIEREIYKLLITDKGDWKTDPRMGTGLKTFIGDQNTRETGDQIKQTIRENLIDTIFPADLEVRVVPVNISKILIFIDLLHQNDVLTSFPFEFTFSLGLKRVTQFDPEVGHVKSTNKLQVNDLTNLNKPNKYWDRLSKSSQI